MAAANPTLLMNRLAGLVTSGPSIFFALSAMNGVVQRFQRRPLQFAIVACAAASIVTDVIILVAVWSWVVTPSLGAWTPLILAINTLKRAHSAITAYLTYVRMAVLVQPLTRGARRLAPLFTFAFAGFGAAAIACQFYAYAVCDWNAGQARLEPAFLIGYRVFNLVCVLLYTVPAIATDTYFFAEAKNSPTMNRRFQNVKPFFNPSLFFSVELVMLFVVGVPLVWAMATGNQDLTASTYTEQLLLSTILLNSTMSLKAAVTLPNESSAYETSEPTSAAAAANGSSSGGGSRSRSRKKAGGASPFRSPFGGMGGGGKRANSWMQSATIPPPLKSFMVSTIEGSVLDADKVAVPAKDEAAADARQPWASAVPEEEEGDAGVPGESSVALGRG
ncbi:hypothetical protein H9P43_008454 [Blastocladiella emersonii ATCC 22665]|nr:hypothetical protein H9P43_008454 [Blastocladiella emersonii ATCC 22665]